MISDETRRVARRARAEVRDLIRNVRFDVEDTLCRIGAEWAYPLDLSGPWTAPPTYTARDAVLLVKVGARESARIIRDGLTSIRQGLMRDEIEAEAKALGMPDWTADTVWASGLRLAESTTLPVETVVADLWDLHKRAFSVTGKPMIPAPPLPQIRPFLIPTRLPIDHDAAAREAVERAEAFAARIKEAQR